MTDRVTLALYLHPPFGGRTVMASQHSTSFANAHPLETALIDMAPLGGNRYEVTLPRRLAVRAGFLPQEA